MIPSKEEVSRIDQSNESVNDATLAGAFKPTIRTPHFYVHYNLVFWLHHDAPFDKGGQHKFICPIEIRQSSVIFLKQVQQQAGPAGAPIHGQLVVPIQENPQMLMQADPMLIEESKDPHRPFFRQRPEPQMG